MLDKQKADVLIACQELQRHGMIARVRGSVSVIDRQAGLIVLASSRDTLVVNLEGTILEGSQTSAPDPADHIAMYQAFPEIGSIVQPHARFAAVFAQVGMDIPVLGSFHTDHFQTGIPCVSSVAELRGTFLEKGIDPMNTPAALVLSHCAFAWGATALDAAYHAIALEDIANLAYHTMQLDPGIRPIL